MCKICGRNTKKITIDNVNYDFCGYCGFLCKTKEFILEPKLEFDRYQKHNNSSNEDYINYQEKFYFEIKEFLGKNVLDFGCGANHILSDILNKNNINSSYYDLYFYPDENYKKNLYDAIILEEVIEHIENPLLVLQDLAMLLNPNGKIIIRTRLIPENVFNIKWWYLRDCTHISFFDYNTFLYLSKLLSLSIIYCNDKDLVILKKE